MDGQALLADMAFHFCIVMCPAVVAGLALQRLFASRSRNRLLYGLTALLSAPLSVLMLADMVAGAQTDVLLTLAALAAPLIWAIVLWTAPAGRTGYFRIADQVTTGPVAAASATVPHPHRPEPELLLETALRHERSAKKKKLRARRTSRVHRPDAPPQPDIEIGPLPFVPATNRLG